MVAIDTQNPPSMDSAAWSELLNQLPLFPPPAHPPPTLYPLLAPLLRQKLGLLSLGRGRNWPGTLTWLPPELSYKVNERLKSRLRQIGLGQEFRGYRRLDEETILANLALREVDLELWYTWIPHPEEGTEAGWKLHDVRLPECDTDLNWFPTVSEATNQFHETKNGNSDEPGDDGSDDDDSYWDQYDQVTGQASALGDTENTLPDVRPSDNGLKSEENHYNQYDNIETTIGDSNLMQDAGQKTVQQPAESIGAAGIADPVDRNEVHDIGLDDYIRSTVRNLGRLAMRCGMPKQRLTELINDAINNA